jgi:hypothetical protein
VSGFYISITETARKTKMKVMKKKRNGNAIARPGSSKSKKPGEVSYLEKTLGHRVTPETVAYDKERAAALKARWLPADPCETSSVSGHAQGGSSSQGNRPTPGTPSEIPAPIRGGSLCLVIGTNLLSVARVLHARKICVYYQDCVLSRNTTYVPPISISFYV